ncbi:MAG: GNAT family protein, partial [Planctomycetota bacterium]
ETHQIIGCVGLILKGRCQSNAAEMGYWVGKPYWNQGYCSEAGAAVIAFAFNTLRLNRVSATCFARNAASARVLEKLGFKNEGRLRQAIMKWGQYEDAFVFGLLKSEWTPPVP